MKKAALALGVAAALIMVTAAHYFFRFVTVRHPGFRLPAYLAFLALLALGGYLFLYRAAQRSYEHHRCLTSFTLFLLCAVWGLFFALPSLYGPYDWAWSFSSGVDVPGIVKLPAVLLVVAGLAGTLAAIVYLGILPTIGENPARLRDTGPYHFSRNPQFAAMALAILGFALLRPSLYAVGWAALFYLLARLMIAAEEEHLAGVFGEEHRQYLIRTPRLWGRATKRLP